jgi:hypothetical protein
MIILAYTFYLPSLKQLHSSEKDKPHLHIKSVLQMLLIFKRKQIQNKKEQSLIGVVKAI